MKFVWSTINFFVNCISNFSYITDFSHIFFIGKTLYFSLGKDIFLKKIPNNCLPFKKKFIKKLRFCYFFS